MAAFNDVAITRLGGEEWYLNGVAVTAIYDARYAKVAFGDERFKNVDMTGVNINATGPCLRLPTEDVPIGTARGALAYRSSDDTTYQVVSIEDDNGITTIRIRRET